MSSKKSDQKFEELAEELKNDSNVLAFWLGGSRGKGFATQNSDYDLVMIVKPEVKSKYEKKYLKNFKDPNFDFFIRTFEELKKHALWGSGTFWDRYNYVYVKVLFDRTVKIQKIIDNKAKLSDKEKKQIINSSLDAFINQVYRSAKCRRDGNVRASHLEIVQAIPLLLDCVFALESRVKPYYKYLEWDLGKHPLQRLPWKKEDFLNKILKLLKDGDEKIALELLVKTRPIFRKAGYGFIYDGWNGKYKVGE